MARRLGLILAGSILMAATSFAQQPPEASRKYAHIDSRAPFVHRIPLLNEQGLAINPAKDTVPYSPAATCGKCHDYASINSGWHFNSNQSGVEKGRPGEPWILLDAATRTQLPLSYRRWVGTFHPSEAGLSDWQFARTFAAHLPGGAALENPATQPADPKALWGLSGRLENDCMICHDTQNAYHAGDREVQIRLMNFKFAPTRAMDLGRVSGSVQQIADEAEAEGSDPLKSKQTPKVAYDLRCFDAEGRVFFNMGKPVPNTRCYYCHTTNLVGPDPIAQWQCDEDVHLSSGLNCVDCHRHGIDHAVVRGYETESVERADPSLFSLSCRGCHLGSGTGSDPSALGGRLGAPSPAHKGIPPVHFDRLSCTACHSGPWPRDRQAWVQTSLAHELGLESFHRSAEQPPRILAGVFLRGTDGKIAPHKVVWPNFWARLDGQTVRPVPPAEVRRAAKAELPSVKENDPKAWEPLDDQKVAKVLTALAATQGTGEPVYISGGKLYRLQDGRLVGGEHWAARPYAWPLAHNVRPASQSLGIAGCSDCHAPDSPIYFSQVAAQGPVSPDKALVKAMYELRGDDGLLARIFALSFLFRTTLKVICFISAAVLLGLLAVYGLRGLAWLSSLVR